MRLSRAKWQFRNRDVLGLESRGLLFSCTAKGVRWYRKAFLTSKITYEISEQLSNVKLGGETSKGDFHAFKIRREI